MFGLNIAGDDESLGVRRVGHGTPLDRVVVTRAPLTATIDVKLADFLLSGHGFGVKVSAGRVITFGSKFEGQGIATYEIKAPWRGICLMKRLSLRTS